MTLLSPACRRDLLVTTAGATPADRSMETRRIRKQAVLNAVRERSPLSRADIAKITGFNMRTTSLLADELVRDGLVSEGAAIENSRGRPPTLLRLNPSAAVVLGIDIGRHRTIGRLMDLGGQLLVEKEMQTPSLTQPRRFAEWARRVGQETVHAASAPLPPLCGIGVGIPPAIAKDSANALLDKDAVSARIREELRKDYDVEVLVDTDARLMALGSLWFGVGRDHRSFALLKIGVGLGLGVVLDGRLLEGARGRDMELGHVPMGDAGVACYCGSWGCLENVVSGTGIERLAREAGLEASGAQQVAELARAGDVRALEVFSRFSEGLGRAVAAVMNLFAPEAVILSGRLSRAADLYVEDTRRALARHAMPSARPQALLIVSDPNARLGALGAVSIVYHHIFHSHHVAVDELI